MRRRLDLSTRDITMLAVLTALPLLGYQFGVGNQVEQFSIVERLRDPNFIAGDFYTDSAATFGPRYYYSLLLSLLTNIAPLPAVILLLTCAASLPLVLVTFAATRTRLGATAAGAAIAAALAVANSSFPLGLAAYLRYESFQPASLAVPLGLLGFVWLTEGNRYAAVGAFFAAALFHPVIGSQTAMIAYSACALADLASRKPFSSLLTYIPSGALFAALQLAAWVLPGMSTQGGVLSSEEFFSILPAFRSPHHYLGTSFPLSHYLQLASFVTAMAVLVVQARRVDEHSVLRVRLIFATTIVLALCAASLILVDGLHNRIAASAQIFRALLLVKWAGFILFGAVAGRWLSTGRPLLMAAPFAVLVATGAAQPPVMLAVTLAALLVERMPIGRRTEIALATVLLVTVAALTLQIGAREEAVRSALAGLSIGLLYLAPITLAPAVAIAVSLMLALIAFGWFNRDRNWVDREIFQPTYRWADVKGDDADIARWVKANTPPGAVWITPPQFEAFRLLAERPIVVDWTSIPFQEDAMREWRRRIRVVYGDVPGGGFVALQGLERNYRSITPEQLAQLSVEFDAPFAVIDRETPWPGAILYEIGHIRLSGWNRVPDACKTPQMSRAQSELIPGKVPMQLKVYSLIISAVAMSAVGQIALKIAVERAQLKGAIAAGVFSAVEAVIGTPMLWVGISVYLGSVVLWLWALSEADLSIAYPFVSLGFVLTMLFAAVILKEAVTPLKLTGTMLIVLGCVLVARSA